VVAVASVVAVAAAAGSASGSMTTSVAGGTVTWGMVTWGTVAAAHLGARAACAKSHDQRPALPRTLLSCDQPLAGCEFRSPSGHSRRFDYLTATCALPRITDISDRPGMSEECDFRAISKVPKVNLAHSAGLAYRLPDNQYGGRNRDTQRSTAAHSHPRRSVGRLEGRHRAQCPDVSYAVGGARQHVRASVSLTTKNGASSGRITVTVHQTIVGHGSTTRRRSPALTWRLTTRLAGRTFTWWPPSTSVGSSSSTVPTRNMIA
jgi:hypothetical protein